MPVQEIKGDLAPTPGANYAIVVARYNETITGKLLAGAVKTLLESGVAEEMVSVFHVPGAWELPVVANRVAKSQQFAAVICLGAVIRGDTTHDQYINQQVSQSLGKIALDCELPVIFGVLTCNNLEQAMQRTGGSVGHKGEEAAAAALEMTSLMQRIQ